MSTPLRLGVLVSGTGRTLVNLADCIDEGMLPAAIALVISSRRDAAAIDRARERGLEVHVAARRDFETEDAMHDQITAWLTEARVDLVCLCGYMRWFRVDGPFAGRVMNIHPALLPEFGGKGMFGTRVHRAVLESDHEVTGCTVHIVDDQYDHGPVILQRHCPILDNDDEETLGARVFEQERLAYPEAIRLFAAGRIKLDNDKVTVLPEEEKKI